MRRSAIIFPAFFLYAMFPTLLPAAGAPKSAASTASGKDMCKDNFDVYRDKLKQNPDDEKAWNELRICADLLKRWGESGAISQGAIDRGVKRPEPHLILGMSHYRMKDYATSVDDFKAAIQLKDDMAIAYFQLGLAYLHLNQPQDAVGAGIRAAELEPDNPAYHHQLAFSYYLTHEDEKCELAAKKAIDLDKNDIAAYKILNNLYTRQGKTALAGQMMEESIHANGRVAAANPFVPDKQLTEQDMPHPFTVSTQPNDTEVYLKAVWEKMKDAGKRGDVEATTSFYCEGQTRDAYRLSFQRMTADRMRTVFLTLGELSDCDIDSSATYASCRCPVNGGSGTMLETKVKFQKDPDHVWRIRAY